MVHPSRTIQTIGLGTVITMYLLQVLFGQPSPVRALRTAVATIPLNMSADDADEPDPDRAR